MFYYIILCMLISSKTEIPPQNIILIKFCLVLKNRFAKVAQFGTFRKLKLYEEVATQSYIWFKNPYNYKIIKC